MRTRFRRSAFLFVAFLSALCGAARAQAPSDVFVDGLFLMLVGDPPPGSGGRSQTIFTLNADDGRTFVLDLSHASLPPEGAHSLYGKRVRARASAAAYSALVTAGAQPALVVEDVARITTGLKSAEISNATGNQKYISLMCKYTDGAVDPVPQSFFIAQLGNVSPGFDHYFQEASYGTLNLTGSSASAAWQSLGHPKSYYLDGVKQPNTYLKQIFDDCIAAHDATIDFSAYYGINIMLNSDIGNAAWGGGELATIDGVTKGWPATWMPYLGPADNQRFGWRQHGVLSHEMSHSFGAAHSESPDGDEYGSLWDVVSSPGGTCINSDATYGCLGQEMIAYAKVDMGIMPAARVATYTSGTQSYAIERLDQPPNAGGTYQMVRVNISGSATRSYTIESRFRIGYDGNLAGDGVLIHEIDTARSSGNPARLVVPGGSTAAGYGALAALWKPGMTFLSAADNVKITIDSFSGDGTANVTVGPYVASADTFPPGCALPAGWTTPAGATTGWSVDTTAAAIGNCSLKSNAMADPPPGPTRVRADIQYTGTFVAGNITFWARASSEATWDCLRFLVDDVQQNVGACINGTGLGLTPSGLLVDTGWQFFSFPVTAGSHTVRWSYEKDNFMRGLDAAWIDSVVFPTSASAADLSIAQAATPSPGNVAKDVMYTLTASNAGPMAATNVAVTDTLPPGSTFVWASPGCVNAAGVVTCTVGPLAAGATAQFKVVARPGSAGTATNNVAIAGTEPDAVPANNASVGNVTVNANPAAVAVFRYRLYSDVTKEHHFTTDLNEYNVLGTFVGTWVQEGTVGKVLDNPGSFNAVVAVPYYRLYNTGTRWHHWTTDANEYYTLGLLYSGWNMEGVDGYILPSATAGATQLFRLNFPALGALHHWTIDTNEYNTLITPAYGWIGEGGSGFVIQ